jgi:hypothetical protein
MSLKTNTRSLIKFSALLCANAWAVDPESIKLADGVTFTPTLKVSERYDDNFRQVEHGRDSSWITGVSPTFVLEAEKAKSAYRLSYKADSDTFHSSTKDNNTDHYLDAEAKYKFDSRNQLKLDAGYQRIEETATLDHTPLDQNPQNDKYTVSHAGGMYTYGARSARGQVEVGVDYEQLRYQNSDGINNDKERNTTALVSTFYYRVAPKTRVLIEGRYTDYDYVSNTTLDSQNVAVLGGVTWEATAKTSGTVKLGAEKKSFDDSTGGSKIGTLGEISAKWKPRTYSTFEAKAGRQLIEGHDGADAIEQTDATLSWEHYWLKRFATNVGYTHASENYQNINRQDKIDLFVVGATYKMRRWLDVGLMYKRTKDDSTALNESYQRNIYIISFTAGL